MTNSLIRLEELQLPDATVALTTADAERIATAIEAEFAPSTRETYAGGWRQWERWCQGPRLQSIASVPGGTRRLPGGTC